MNAPFCCITISLALSVLATGTFAQNAQPSPANHCEVGAGAMTAIITLRREGLTREQVNSTILGMKVFEKEHLLMLGVMVDKVYGESMALLDTLPRKVLIACTGESRLVSSKTIDATLKQLRVQHDRMTGMSWYYHPSSPKYSNTNGFYLYFGRNENGQFTVMHLVSRYYGSDWLFIKNAWALADGQRLTVPQYSMAPSNEWLRDNVDSGVWESFDADIIKTPDIAIVRKLAESRDVMIRYEGRNYFGDRKVSEKQLAAMRSMIQSYEIITGVKWR